MLEREARLHSLMYRYLRMLLKDSDDEQLAIPIGPGGNCPAWILAHVAVVNDYALRMLGAPRIAKSEWHKRFGPGGSPSTDTAPLPSKSELVEVLEAGHQSLLAAVQQADPQKLEQPHSVDFFKDSPLETVADVVAHMMTTHIATHLGQLSAWRRQQGKPPLF